MSIKQRFDIPLIASLALKEKQALCANPKVFADVAG
jgi:hypothetical protein